MTEDGTPLVSVLDSEDATLSGLTLGAPALAHGSHDVPSTWWDAATGEPWELESVLTYDATAVDGVLVEATLRGLSVVIDGGRTDLVAARAMRFVAG